MLNKILDRLKEPSSYAGLAAITLGAGQIFKINEAEQVAETLNQAGAAAASGDIVAPVATLILGLAAFFRSEKK
tara:strand:+ start:756 stop:977 length:222 start_codon:yes stop_codon:yes gene_type:complete